VSEGAEAWFVQQPRIPSRLILSLHVLLQFLSRALRLDKLYI
jgi:hypothetical protein